MVLRLESLLFAQSPEQIVKFGLIGLFLLITAAFLLVIAVYGKLWFQAYMSSADVTLANLVGMGFRRVNPRVIVRAKVMAKQAGLSISRSDGISTDRLEAHFLAGGNVMGVIKAIIAAHRAGIDLDFDKAAAIDLAGRDVLDAVRTSVDPKVIDWPRSAKKRKDNVECYREGRCRASHSGPSNRADQYRAANWWCYRGDRDCPRG